MQAKWVDHHVRFWNKMNWRPFVFKTILVYDYQHWKKATSKLLRLGRIQIEKITCQSFPSIFEAKKGGRKGTEKAKYVRLLISPFPCKRGKNSQGSDLSVKRREGVTRIFQQESKQIADGVNGTGTKTYNYLCFLLSKRTSVMYDLA